MITVLFDNSLLFCVVLFLGLVLCLELGRLIGRRRLARDPDAAQAGTSVVDGAVFALLGLLVAFTFSGAAVRFEHRRDLIVSEANDIGTAYLRVDVAPVTAQPALREAFHRYIDSRMAAYQDVEDADAFKLALDKSATIQREIWDLAVAAGRLPDAAPALNILLLPALNQMFDITTTRTMATRTHPPVAIFGMLIALTFLCSILAGHGMMAARSRNLVHVIGFAAIMTLTLYVTLDLEYPRLGFIRVNSFDFLIKDAVK